MQRIGIVVNRPKDKCLIHTRRVVESIVANGCDAVVCEDIAAELGLVGGLPEEALYRETDAIVCLGGDGTFLKAARGGFGSRRPILGINLGSVGFLAEVETPDIETAVRKLTSGQVLVQERMVLRTEVIRDGSVIHTDFAINDAVVTRKAISRVLGVHVEVDAQIVDSFNGDGLIVSTPSGSTAYTLSAGGPIVRPDMKLMILTPICPHILYSRSFVVPAESEVRINIEDMRRADAMLTVDGQDGVELMHSDVVRVSTAGEPILLASVTHVNFYDILRAKIRGRT